MKNVKSSCRHLEVLWLPYNLFHFFRKCCTCQPRAANQMVLKFECQTLKVYLNIEYHFAAIAEV